MSNFTTNSVSPRTHWSSFEDRGENQVRKEERNKDVKKAERSQKETWRRKVERKSFFLVTDNWGGFDGAGEAGHKVEETVSITPGTHRRIIC